MDEDFTNLSTYTHTHTFLFAFVITENQTITEKQSNLMIY